MTSFFKRKYRVLLVNDDELFCELVRMFFETACCEFRFATCPRCGLECLKEHWDLILIDLRMSDMSGVDWIKMARQLVEGLEIVVIADFLDDSTLTYLAGLGVNQILSRPVDFHRLREVLKTVIHDKHVTAKLERIAGTSLGRLEDVARSTEDA